MTYHGATFAFKHEQLPSIAAAAHPLIGRETASGAVDDESFLVIPGALDVGKNGLNVWMLFHTWLLSEHSA